MSMMPKIEDVELDLENTPPGLLRQQKPPEISLLTGGFIDEVDSKYSSFSFLDLLRYPIQGLPYISNTTTIPPLSGSFDSSSLPSLVPPPPDVTSLLLLDSTAKPNSPSMSSSSADVANQARSAVTETWDEGEKKSKNQKKRQRQQRFAFVTRTEVDHLEDGYRWRKYGQKPVKNSSFLRSYYRCTSATCGVKKTVERSSEDPTVVVTTYEGQHTHTSPVSPRGGHLTVGGLLSHESTQTPSPLPPPYVSLLRSPAMRFNFDSGSYGGNLGYGGSNHGLHDGTDVVRDHGLLQDLVPSDVRKEH